MLEESGIPHCDNRGGGELSFALLAQLALLGQSSVNKIYDPALP